MRTFSIQFHAALDELVEYVATWLTQEPIHAVAVTYFPYSATVMALEQTHTDVTNDKVARIMFTTSAPDCSADRNTDLLDRNRAPLLLDIGRLNKGVVEESRLSTLEALPPWKRIAADLRRRTLAGATGINEQTGAHGFYRNHRYTLGAKALADSGVTMRQFAQSPVRLIFSPLA